MAGKFLLYSFLAILLGSIIGVIICAITTPKGEKYNWGLGLVLIGVVIFLGAFMWIGIFSLQYFLT